MATILFGLYKLFVMIKLVFRYVRLSSGIKLADDV